MWDHSNHQHRVYGEEFWEEYDLESVWVVCKLAQYGTVQVREVDKPYQWKLNLFDLQLW